jgi:hypothetical protein
VLPVPPDTDAQGPLAVLLKRGYQMDRSRIGRLSRSPRRAKRGISSALGPAVTAGRVAATMRGEVLPRRPCGPRATGIRAGVGDGDGRRRDGQLCGSAASVVLRERLRLLVRGFLSWRLLDSITEERPNYRSSWIDSSPTQSYGGPPHFALSASSPGPEDRAADKGYEIPDSVTSMLARPA